MIPKTRMGVNSTSSTFSHFVLGAYLPIGNLRYLYFTLTALLYVAVVTANTSLVLLIGTNRSLRQPMYVFLCSLLVNELYGSTGLFPLLLEQILSDVHVVSTSLCLLQIFCLYTYASVEFCNLAVMSYDRYLAICSPLQYNRLMPVNRALVWIAVIWLYSCVKLIITLSLNIRLPLCRNVINSLYCHNYLVVKLACSDTTLNNIYGLFSTVITVLLPLGPIVFSYVKILQVCFSASRQKKQKAISTCAPHLVSLLNFSFGCFTEILQSRFDMSSAPRTLRMVLSLYFLLIQPLLNPLMYGLQMSKLRSMFKQLLCWKTPRGE